MKDDVSVKIVCELTGYSPSTVNRMCKRNYPNAYQLNDEKNRQWFIPAEDVAALYPEAKRAVVLAKLEQLAQMHELK